MSNDRDKASERFWNPFADMRHTKHNRVVFVRGDGCELVDRDGNTYLDATASLWYCNVGHGRQEIASAIGTQAAKLASCSCFDVYASDVTLELADRVSELSPLNDAAVFLTSGGSDSVDTAAKLARRYWAELGEPDKTFVLSRELGLPRDTRFRDLDRRASSEPGALRSPGRGRGHGARHELIGFGERDRRDRLRAGRRVHCRAGDRCRRRLPPATWLPDRGRGDLRRAGSPALSPTKS